MAFITLQGTLLDPNGSVSIGDELRFTHKSTTGSTLKSAVTLMKITTLGNYYIDLQYGLVLVEYKDVKNNQFENLGVVTVNQDSTATTLPELLNAVVPPTNAQLLEFQAILADCVSQVTLATTQAVRSETAASISEAFANQLTTTELIASTSVYAADVVLLTSGFSVSGSGSGSWKQNGITGQTPSQTPAQLGNASLLNDANGNQWSLINDGTAPVEASGGVSGGVTDNALVFQAFLNSGVIGVLANNKTYATGSRSSWVLGSSGFISSDNSKILMLTAGFDATTYINYAGNSVGFYAIGIDNPIFKNIHVEFESHATVRTSIALAVRNCTDIDIDIEASGFSEPQYGVVTMDSCIGGTMAVYTHDITSNNNSLPSLQLTGLMVDENRISSIYSKDVHIKTPRFENITLGAAAIAAFGYQTDGLTLAGGASSGGGGCVVDVVNVTNVYEGVDIQSSNHVITGIKARNINNSPLKMVHAGKNNTIGDINAVNTGDAVVVIAGTNTSSESADNNTIGNIVATGVGNLTGSGAAKCGVHFAGSAAILKPNNNKVTSVTITDSPNMLNTVLDEAGQNNKVLSVSGTGTNAVGLIDSGQLASTYVDLKKSPKSFINAHPSADLVGLTDGTILIFNTAINDNYSELNLANGKFTSVSQVKGRISVTVRTAQVGSGEFIGLDIVAGGVVIATQKDWNDSAGNREGIVSLSVNFALNNSGVEVYARLRTNAAALTITGNAEFTSLNIEEV
jgi:hypothetical protein